MKFRLTSEYGELSLVRDHPHRGIDIAMPENTTLRSIADGVVERVVDFGNENIGKGVMIRHEDGTVAIYGHLNEINVKPGQHVDAGDVIGLSGNTGHSTGPHLHFGMKDAQGNFVDPTPIAERVDAMSGNDRIGQWALDKYNAFSDWFVGKEIEFIVKPFLALLREGAELTVNGLTSVMPEIGALITVVCAVMMMLTGNVSRWVGVWFLGTGGAIIWLIST
jgi:Peptidase family M23